MTKILLVSKDGVGASFLPRLMEEGHNVTYYLLKDQYAGVLDGIVPKPIHKKPDFSNFDLVLFDISGNAHLAEEALKVTPTIGDGDLNTELEENRVFGIQVMEECGINVPPYEEFADLNEAKRFIRKTNKRFVFKPNGDQSTACTYVSKSPEDMLRHLDRLSSETKGEEFILQEVVQGTEISTEGWFNGEEFFLINSTLEEKKLMNDNKGPNTGCAGNLVWTYKQGTGNPYIFVEGLSKLKDFLHQYNYRGMIDLNTIIGDRLYGLEWTPRFGYDAAYTLFNLISSNLGDFLGAIASGSTPDYEIKGLFSAAIRLGIPPYPSEIKGKHPEGVPIEGIEPEDCVRDCYLYDACISRGELVTCGVSGMVAVPVGKGDTINQAFLRVQGRVDKIQIPNMMYRTDLEKTTYKRYEDLDREGWLS